MSAENIINWFVDTLARTETLDLYFIITDLIDFPQNEAEIYESACGDAEAVQASREARPRKRIPLGKQVF